MKTPQQILSETSEAVESMLNDLLDDDKLIVPWREALAISESVGVHVSTVVKMAKSLGFEVEKPTPEKTVRGFQSNPNTRWQACPSHGGSGWEVISGFAGREG